MAGSNECRLVADVSDVSSRETRCLAGKQIKVDRAIGLDVAQVYLENLLAVTQLGKLYVYLPVEASGAQQGFVQDIGTVGGGQNDDTTVGAEAVHLGKQLVKRALALVVAAHASLVATGTSHGVNLVDKNDAGRFFLGLAEQITHSRSAYADKHLDEIRT